MICGAPDGKPADYEDRNANIIGTVHRAVRLIYYAREGILRGASGWQMLSALNGQGFGILSQQAPEQRFLLYWLYYYFNRHVGEWALRTEARALPPAAQGIGVRGSPHAGAGHLKPRRARDSLVIANGSSTRGRALPREAGNFRADAARGRYQE